MKTSLDCIPCFFTQLLSAARRAAPADAALHRKMVLAWANKLDTLDFTQSPPALARHLYSLVATLSGDDDIFSGEKKRANARALEFLPVLRTSRDSSPDPLRRALELAIIGNYMDCGVPQEFDWEGELEQLDSSLDEATYSLFAEQAEAQRTILVLGDNGGEIVFDMLLVEALLERGCRVTYAVRGEPIINDATIADAESVGMTRLCEVISSGVDTPGTVLDRCSPDFLERMDGADLVLSKGQGNFEALCHARPDCFFAFKVKCAQVAEMTGKPIGHSMFYTATKLFAR